MLSVCEAGGSAQSCLLQTLKTLFIWFFITNSICSKVIKGLFLNEVTRSDGRLPNCRELYNKLVEYSLGGSYSSAVVSVIKEVVVIRILPLVPAVMLEVLVVAVKDI